MTLVPEGLILLASVTYAVAALRMARRGALAQQLNAIESLASVDVVCLDKTGTSTEPRLESSRLLPAEGVGEDEVTARAAEYAAATRFGTRPSRRSGRDFPAAATAASATVPFSSRQRFGAVRTDGHWIVVGAPELFELGSLESARHEAAAGRRVIALGTPSSRISDHPPNDLPALGIAVLGERLRPEARETVEFFRRQGVELKVLGRPAETVAAVAADVGIETAQPVDEATSPSPPKSSSASSARRA